MGYVLQLVLALLLVALADSDLAPATARPLWIPLLIPVPFALALLSRRSALRGRFRLAGALERLLRFSGPACFAIALLGLGWALTVEEWAGTAPSLTVWPDLGLLVALLLFVVFELLAIEARARLAAHGPRAVRAFRSFQMRLFVSTVAPFALYGGLAGAIGWSPSARILVEEVALLDTAFSAGIVLVFATTLPAMLRRAWDTVPLERGPRRALLETVARAAHFECRELLVWRTGGTVANAAVVGFTRRHRFVVFTDALIGMLEPLELAAVFGHEIGHARGRHPLVFAAWAIGYFLAAGLLVEALPPLGETELLLLFAGLLVVFWVCFGWMSRRFELEADLTSAELTDGGPSLMSALERVSGPGHRERRSWRHFSTERRVAFLAGCLRDPALGARLKAKLRLLARAGVVLFLAALAGRMLQDGRRLPSDLVFVDLRHGRFEDAAERHAAGRELGEPFDAALAVLVDQVAARSGEAPLSLASVEELARMAARAGEPAAARAWLLLAGQAGSTDASQVLAALIRASAEGPGEGRAALRLAAEVWWAPFQPLVDAAMPLERDP